MIPPTEPDGAGPFDTVESCLRLAPFIWSSASMKRVVAEASRAGPALTPVLIRGESGTGKLKLARLIHEKSPRHKKSFFIWSAPECQEGLVQSTLFGHLKGAFTGATENKPGIIKEADGGTLLIDDADKMRGDVQRLMLRFLDEPTILPVGASRTESVDVRLIVSTNRDLQALARKGEYLPDLANRFSTALVIDIPPLRERKEDIRPLAEYLVKAFAERYAIPSRVLSSEALRTLEAQHWPGNVRELAGVLHNAVFRSQDGKLDLQKALSAPGTSGSVPSPQAELEALQALPMDLRRTEGVLRRALELGRWNKKETARALDIPLRTFHRDTRRFSLKRKGDWHE